MTDNNHNHRTKQKERLQKHDTPKSAREGLEAASQQYADLEQIAEAAQTSEADMMLAVDQAVLQQVIAHPQALTSKTVPSLQRTVGNRTVQQMIARTVAGQQAFPETDWVAKTNLERELETIVNRRTGQSMVSHSEQLVRQSQTNTPPRKANINLPEDEYEQAIFFQEEKS